MGLLDSLKSVFVEYKEVPDEPAKEGQVSAAAPPSGQAVAAGQKVFTATPAPVVSADFVKALDESSRKTLIDAVSGSGAHLVEELGDILDTLKDSIPDEGALYKAALKMLGKKGHTAPDILGDYDKCLGAIEQKDREFDSQLKAQFQKRVGSKQQEIDRINGEIAAKKTQIDQLQQEMADLAVKSRENQGEITEEQQKLEIAHNRFEAVYKAIRSEIEGQREKITKFGGVA